MNPLKRYYSAFKNLAIMNTNQKILFLVILFLVATNITTIVLYRNHLEEHINQAANKLTYSSPGNGQGFGLLKQLDLTEEQSVLFRSAQQEFNQTAGEIDQQMSEIRQEILDQLETDPVDTNQLQRLSKEYGSLHSQLKESTVQFYLFMKENCTGDQKEKLQLVFRKLLNDEKSSGRSGRGGQWRGGHKKEEHTESTN
jgi:Spy/CpxP family protein refolding chaperone